jgi:hypothetical protein
MLPSSDLKSPTVFLTLLAMLELRNLVFYMLSTDVSFSTSHMVLVGILRMLFTKIVLLTIALTQHCGHYPQVPRLGKVSYMSSACSLI